MRGRNAGKQLGDAPWVMFLDDDVALGADCIRQLVDELQDRPLYGALGADYLGERRSGILAPHVAMGATLFRRDALERIRFRWQDGRCECQCCCDDLRRMLVGIDYSATARARHIAIDSEERGGKNAHACRVPVDASLAGRVLAAFDRRHFTPFRHRFLPSLRAAGNHEHLTAVTFGLYPSQRRRLEMQPHVTVVACPVDRRHVPQRRLQEFQPVLQRMHPDTPVAYWDVGDCFFQGSLEPLWQLVREHPDRLLVAREPISHPENGVVAAWTLSIHDPSMRQRAFELLSQRPILNGGFAAGTARSLLNYLQAADELLHSPALAGTTDWGDQTAMNLYCHSDPDTWHEVPDTWNYCLYGRVPGEVQFGEDGRLIGSNGTPIHVVHGNGGSLRTVLAVGQSWRTDLPRPIASSFLSIR